MSRFDRHGRPTAEALKAGVDVRVEGDGFGYSVGWHDTRQQYRLIVDRVDPIRSEYHYYASLAWVWHDLRFETPGLHAEKP